MTRRRELIEIAVVIAVGVAAAAVIVLVAVLLGRGASCEPGGQAPADMPHVIVRPQPIPFPGPSGGVR